MSVSSKEDAESEPSDFEEDPLIVEEERRLVANRSFPWLIVASLCLLATMKVSLFFLPGMVSVKSPALFEPDAQLEVDQGVPTADSPEVWQAPTPASSATVVPSSSTISRNAEALPTPTSDSDVSDQPTWPYHSFRTENFTAPKLEVEKALETVPGLLFFGPRGNGTHSQAPMIMTEEGDLVWHGPSGTSTNMMLQVSNGSPHITFWQGNSAFTFGHGYGAVHVLNASYDEVAVVCPQNLGIIAEEPDANLDCYLDMHESFITPSGTLVVTGYNITKTDLSSIGGSEDGWVWNSMFYEIDPATEEILFHWKSLDHLDQIPLNRTKYPLFVRNAEHGLARALPFDWFHINSVQKLDDGYLVNSRHTWSVYKLTNNGSVEWYLDGESGGGDFQTNDDIRFSWQHDVRAANITSTSLHLTMFSNSNSEAQEEMKDSKGLEIFLDLDARHATVLRSLVDPDDVRHSNAMGSWQSLPDDHVLIGYGKDATIKEFNYTDQVVWSAKFGHTTEGNGGLGVVASYRAYKFPWSATPRTAPRLVAEYAEDERATRLFASWNGATPDVFDNWRVSYGDSSDELTNLETSYDRTGFETEMRVTGRHTFWQVTARLGAEDLRSSGIMSVS